MSAFDYPNTKAVTLSLLTKFGKTLSLERESDGGVFDPATGGITGGGTTILNGVGVLLNYSNTERNNSDVQSTDRKLLFQGDALEINDKYGDYRVYQIMNLDPDESGTILTTAQLRK
tara:strand:- start:282 stop:632 length:351 start_codon:yes stop_codon:yes gene_type:complete